MGKLLFGPAYRRDGQGSSAAPVRRPEMPVLKPARLSVILESMTTWRTHIEPFTRPLFFAFSRATRGMTLGVRTVAVDDQGRVMLVKHTYIHGWWLPGGGVDRGETTQDAAARELREETGLIATAPPRLISIHSNERFFRGDHVLVYIVDAFQAGQRSSHGEIADARWFSPDALPEDAHRSTRARLAEIFGRKPVDPAW